MAADGTWLGIDIGAGSAKLALCDSVGTAVATAQSARYDRPAQADLAGGLREAIGTLQQGQGDGQLRGVGLAVPGPVEPGQTALPRCGNLPALEGLDASGWVQSLIGRALPVRVVTDQHAAAHAEWSTAPRSGRTLVLTLGTGVGGSLLDDGEPLTFTRGTPGHLGHLDVSGGGPDAPATGAAGRGALEAYLGAGALRSAGLELDDPAACAQHPAMPGAISALARGLRIMLALYRMDHIVLAGGVAPVFGPVLDQVEQRVRDGLTTVAPVAWTLELGSVGLFAGAVGAARLAAMHHAQRPTH